MLTAPKLDYALLAPILVILGAALIGLLVEAFIKQAWRARMQLVIALGAIVVSFNLLVRVRNQGSSIAAVTSVSIDGAGMFLQGAILIFAFLGILVIADQDNFVPQASALPGSAEEAAAIQAGKQQTEVFYDIHKDRPFFGELVEAMTSGPITVMVLARPNAVAAWRDLMGATNPAEAAEGTLRKQFGKNIGENATHGSDSIQNALREISLFFPDMLTNPEKAS